MCRKAFTLIEILVVLAIMLLLMAIVLPAMKKSLDDSKVREASRQLSSYFSMAKTRAATIGRPCGVWLDATEYAGSSSQLYLTEIPPSYSGDLVGSQVAAAVGNYPLLLTFSAGSNGGLYTLVEDGEAFSIKFDFKPAVWPGIRNGNQFFITGPQTAPRYGDFVPPPRSNPNGYAFEIIRSPKRIGSPRALPRGTSVDMTYSGLGNTGTEFGSLPALVVVFAPDGHLVGVRETVHFLVGRPEKIIAPRFSSESNIVDNKALWVSVASMTGTVTTTDNSADATLPTSTLVEQAAFLLDARKFARERDVKGGQ